MNKIIGLKKCIGSYKRLNSGGFYSPHYGVIMFDLSSSEIWTDEFYSLGHCNWKEYASRSIIPLLNFVDFSTADVNMYNVKKACDCLLIVYRSLGLDLFLSTYGLQKMEVFLDEAPDIDQHHPGQYADPEIPFTPEMQKQIDDYFLGLQVEKGAKK